MVKVETAGGLNSLYNQVDTFKEKANHTSTVASLNDFINVT